MKAIALLMALASVLVASPLGLQTRVAWAQSDGVHQYVVTVSGMT
jgi:hypothetical protein